MTPLKSSLIGSLLFITIGLVGAIPFFMLGLIFGNVETGRNIYMLSAAILGSWLPLKILIDSQIKGQVNFRLPDIRLSSLSLMIIALGFMVIIPFLYFVTAGAFFVGALTYAFFGGNLLFAMAIALIMQTVSMIRGAQREKETGSRNNIFMRVQDFGSGGFDVSLDPETITRQEPRQADAPILYLPEDNLRDYEPQATDDTPMTITLDPEALTEQDNDE